MRCSDILQRTEPKPISVSHLQPADYPEILRRYVEDARCSGYVFTKGGEIIGFILAWETPLSSIDINAIVLLPEYSYLGYEKLMLEMFMDRFADKRISVNVSRGDCAYKVMQDAGFYEREYIAAMSFKRGISDKIKLLFEMFDTGNSELKDPFLVANDPSIN